jgi:hypothetical protein
MHTNRSPGSLSGIRLCVAFVVLICPIYGFAWSPLPLFTGATIRPVRSYCRLTEILKCSTNGNLQVDLTRAQIQDLAKKNGVKANLKTADIIAALQAKGIPLTAATDNSEFKNDKTKRTEPGKASKSRGLDDGILHSETAELEKLLQDSLDAFDIEEFDNNQLEEELTRRGLPLDGDFEVVLLPRDRQPMIESFFAIVRSRSCAIYQPIKSLAFSCVVSPCIGGK